uniref:Uncharacterized protein n=1 Tax=Oryza glumipatula TaxID=40148 RepID=A0A0E0BDL8_9ORYZ
MRAAAAAAATTASASHQPPSPVRTLAVCGGGAATRRHRIRCVRSHHCASRTPAGLVPLARRNPSRRGERGCYEATPWRLRAFWWRRRAPRALRLSRF